MFENKCWLSAALHGGARGRPVAQLPLPLVLCACRDVGNKQEAARGRSGGEGRRGEERKGEEGMRDRVRGSERRVARNKMKG